MLFYKRLRTLSESSNTKQSDLAKFLGVAKTTVNGYFRGTSEPDFETLKKIADFYKVSTDYLLDHKANTNADFLDGLNISIRKIEDALYELKKIKK